MSEHQAAIVYNGIAHYRDPIFGLLCRQKGDIEYTLFADPNNTINSVETIDPQKATLRVEEGGLRWKFVKTIRLVSGFLWQRGVLRLAFSKEYDVIIYLGTVYYLSTWVSCFLARLMGKKTLMWSHGFLHNEQGPKGWIRKQFYRLAHGMLLYHNRARKIMIEKGFNPQQLYVIYNSLDYDKQVHIRESISPGQLDNLKQKLFKQPELPVLVFIGRLTSQKRLNLILEAVHILKNDGLLCNLILVGEGPEKENLTQLAIKYDLKDNICFYGPSYDEEEIAPLIMLSDICISPGEVGLTCMHSLVYGTPVITHDNFDYQGPEHEAIAPGKNGVFFNHGCIEDLARVIRKWLKEARPREKVSLACQEVIDTYYNPHYQVTVINAAVHDILAHKEK